MQISACMIVKNEEQNIERCLLSLKDFVDEIIVVDTGSTDKTLEIITELSLKLPPVRLFHHEWQNDFSLHRNQSIDYASGGWVFIVDADEELKTEYPFEQFKEEIDSLPADINAIKVTLHDMQQGKLAMEMTTPRFFRKDKVRYNGIVHNAPELSEGSAAQHQGIILNHYGYDLTEEQREAKKTRTQSLLHARLEKNPGDYEVFFYLCQLHHESKEFGMSKHWGEKYLEAKDKLEDGVFNQSVYFTMYRLYHNTGDTANAAKIIQVGLRENPDNIDLSLALCEYGNQVQNIEVAKKGAEAYIMAYAKIQAEPLSQGNRFIFTNKPDCLAYCLKFLVSYHFHSGIHHLGSLLNIFPAMTAKYMAKMREDLKQDILSLDIFKTIRPLIKSGKKKKRKNEIKAKAVSV